MSKKHTQFNKGGNAGFQKKSWDSGLKTAKYCGHCDAAEINIFLLPDVRQKIHAITDEVRHLKIEWLGYLIGTRKDDNVTITEMIVPEQLVSGGSVEVLDQEFAHENLIGTVHLHPFGGKAGFSMTDEDNIGENHDVMIVMNIDGEMKGSAFQTLECGATMRVDAKVVLVQTPNPDLDKFVDESLLKIKVFTPAPTQPNIQTQYSQMPQYGVRYCGKCRGEIKEARLFINSVAYCEVCLYAEGKPNKPIDTVTCVDCKKVVTQAEAEVAWGIPRCKTCFETWDSLVHVVAK